MVSQQQATASIAVIGGVLSYVLWSIVNTGTFSPYFDGGSPNIGNIMLCIALISVIVAGVLTVLVSLLLTLVSWIRKRESSVSGASLWVFFLGSTIVAQLVLLLHVFSLVPLWISLLSCAVICSIVGYGKYKEKNKYKKYLTASDRGRKSEGPVEVRVQ